MITIDVFRGIKNTETMELMGLSTDEKPIREYNGHAIKNASTYFEMDTSKCFIYDEENHQWFEMQEM